MYKFGIPMKLAKELVKYRRSVVDPNAGFIRNMKAFEEIL